MLNLSMSDSPTFKVQIPSAEELAKRTPKDFMDAIEFGMISSSQLGKGDDYQLFAGLLDNELGLEQNEEFARLSRVMQDVRKSMLESSGIKALADLQKSPTYVKFVDEQNAIREQIIKATQPSEAVQSMLDSIAGAGSVLAKHQKIWRDRALEIQQEIENVEVQITKLTPPLEFKDGGRVPSLEELAMQVKSYEIELETKKAELQQCSMFAKELDPVMVSDFHKQLEKDIQQFIKRKETKKKVDGGVSKKQQQKLNDIYKLWKKYSSVKVGKLYAEDKGEEDIRKRRYSNEECYNLIKAELKLNLENSVIAKYIKDYKK